MTEGPLGGPRPFASDSTVKMMARVTDRINKTNFNSVLPEFSSIVRSPVESRIIRTGSTRVVVVDTEKTAVALDDLEDLKSAMQEAAIASGGEVAGPYTIVTPKQ